MCKKTISSFEFMKRFSTEMAAREFFENRRWANGVVCPKCQGENTTPKKREGYHLCRTCKGVFTVKTGTPMSCSNIPLSKWLYAMYLITTARKGVSSLQMSKELGITQKSAWFMQHRIREACKDDGEMLSGVVEIDETYIGGKEYNKHANKRRKGSQGGSGKYPVLGMVGRRLPYRQLIA